MGRLSGTEVAMNFDQNDYKKKPCLGFCFILFLMLFYVALLSIGFFAEVRTQQCLSPGGVGPCLPGGMCPGAYVCLNNDFCCMANEIIPDPTIPPVTIPVVTTAPIVIIPSTRAGGVTVAPGTCVDLVNPTTGVSDCPSRVSLCSNSLYYDLMTTQCPRTCGRCTTSSIPATCVDKVNPSTGRSNCASMASYCNNAAYYSLMTDQCPRTCGRCTTIASTAATTTCVDKINASTGTSDCTKMVSYCNNSLYYDLMTTQCPRTCGRCTSSSSSSTTTCVDQVNASTGRSDCTAMVSYCRVGTYAALMQQQCPRTCGYC